MRASERESEWEKLLGFLLFIKISRWKTSLCGVEFFAIFGCCCCDYFHIFYRRFMFTLKPPKKTIKLPIVERLFEFCSNILFALSSSLYQEKILGVMFTQFFLRSLVAWSAEQSGVNCLIFNKINANKVKSMEIEC